jgi:hypothetical protein
VFARSTAEPPVLKTRIFLNLLYMIARRGRRNVEISPRQAINLHGFSLVSVSTEIKSCNKRFTEISPSV